MKSFLVNKDKKPTCKWGSLKDNTFYEGKVPEGYSLAISPGKYVVLDIDKHHGINGFDNIPASLREELDLTYQYKTKNNGAHYWLYYTGDKVLLNKTSGLGIDLRTNKGYVVFYPEEDIRECIDLIQETSLKMNKWLEKLF